MTDSKVIIHKGRTNTLRINLGINVSADTFTSEIRAEPTLDSLLIVAWVVAFVTNGADGKLILTIDDQVSKVIAANSGYMDLKRVTGSEPVPVFDKPLEVSFQGTVTQ